MRKTIRKLFWAWDFDKEEKWLNEMSALGLHLTGVAFGKYDFDEGLPGEYIYRLELFKHFPSHPESEIYIRFLEETGAEHIGSFKKWVFFRKKSEYGGFDLYSDIDSRINQLNKVLKLTGFCAMAESVCLVGIIITLINAYIQGGHIISDVYGLIIEALIILLLVILMGRGFFKILNKKKALQKERAWHE